MTEPNPLITLTIDGQTVTVPQGTTILNAARSLNIEVPVFCYHERLSVAGNCRMCLVQLDSSPKPIASCAMPVAEGMCVKTTTEMVTSSRAGALEFLLLNHPLDCPVCDQGGECDLQDITMAYGRDHSRFSFYKRSVPEKDLGPLIQTAMTRCIHCTRCVRFATEVAGVPEMGALHRGEHTEITSYLVGTLTSELSGNMIDLCPVGALTSKPYAYKGRPWEMTYTDSIDVLDGQGCAIRIDTRGPEIMRILPRINDRVNEEWISDKARFSYDGLTVQRLDRPYIRNRKGLLKEASWVEALNAIKQRLSDIKGSEIAGISGDLVDLESLLLFKTLLNHLKSPHRDGRSDGAKGPAGPRCSYLFNTTIQGVDEADFFLFIGTNPRVEAPVLNARIRRNVMTHKSPVVLCGAPCDLTYPVDVQTDSPNLLTDILSGTHPLCAQLKQAKRPVLILGQGALRRQDSLSLLKTVRAIAETYAFIQPDWCGFNVLSLSASRVGALELGLLPGSKGRDTHGILEGCTKGKIRCLFLLGADDLPLERTEGTFIVYQGHHGDRGAMIADVILPSAAYTEKDGLYLNFEGRLQEARKATNPPGEAKADWEILSTLMQTLGFSDGPLTQEQVRERLGEEIPSLPPIGQRTPAPWEPFLEEIPETPMLPDCLPFDPVLSYFHMTDVISRHSQVMAQCVTMVQKTTATVPSGEIS